MKDGFIINLNNTNLPIFDAIFFSPHFDDAILSAGGFIKQLINKKKKLLIVTIFTQSDDTIFSQSSLSFLKKSKQALCGTTLFKARKTEDRHSANLLKTQTLHLSYIDGLFRKGLNQKPLYPSYESLFSGKIAQEDSQLHNDIISSIMEQVLPSTSKQTKFYGPLGVGNHADHLITFEVMRTIFRSFKCWQDVPYDSNALTVSNRLTKLDERTTSWKKTIVDIHTTSDIKQRAVKEYKTQFEGLVEAGLQPKHFFQEVFYEFKN